MPFFPIRGTFLRNILPIFVKKEGHFTKYFHPVCESRMTKKQFRNLVLTLLMFGSCFPGVTLMAQSLPIAPAVLTGVVTNALNGIPVVGAKIKVVNRTTYSVAGGFYTLVFDSAGTFIVNVSKAGFDAYTSTPVSIQQGATFTLPVSISENLNTPGQPVVSFDTVHQVVHLTWNKPTGNYELIQDDGIQDNFTVWSQPGNMNAVRFTPVAYPAFVTGGSINIGHSANYPAGSNPFVTFQVKLLDANGPNGTPGNVVAGPFNVMPNTFGWVEFSLPSAIAITSGSFYLVMVQGGNAPNAAGLAVDESSSQLRSYARFVTGGAPWLPAQGNFMMRVIMNGPGGPVNMSNLPEEPMNYQVWRLRQGEEQNPAIWAMLSNTNNLSLNDSAWPSLPCGPYRWAVKAAYSGNRLSPAAFSNVLGKCWTVPMVVQLQFTCAVTSPRGAYVQMKNLVYPDTLYSAVADSSGFVTFPHVWKGYYQIYVKKFGHIDFYQNQSADHADTVKLMVLQKQAPPSNLVVDGKSLLSVWDIPGYNEVLFNEDWSSGNFVTQEWVLEGGQNFRISTTMGNPKPSAMFSWEPPVVNYEQSLVSKPIDGEFSPILTLGYDINLDNFSSVTLNQMAVEIKYDSVWHNLKTWSNAGGNISWTHDQIDISQFSDKTIQIRFRSFGVDSYQINGWYIDNISIIGSVSPAMLAPCILGYNFYIDNALIASVTGNQYPIPGENVKYDSAYEACVVTVYASGYSEAACDSFTSQFLWPPANLAAVTSGNNAVLSWEKPRMPADTGSYVTPPGLLGYNLFRNNSQVSFIPFPDSLSFSDPALEPGSYSYFVNARYDLTSYGFPGQQDSSPPAGPALVEISYGLPLPFSESWDQGTFTYQGWNFTPGQGNWTLNLNIGNPAPSAEFTGFPSETDYAHSLESPVLDASALYCATVWLDFDIRLQDMYANGTEEMVVEVYYNGIWHKKATWKNFGSFDWTPAHVDISTACGKSFRIRFRAAGLNSTEILGWNVDNVAVYAVCRPPTNLQGTSAGDDIQLQWSPPQCNGGGFILNEDFEGAEFPPQHWTRIIQNTNATWSHTDYASPVGVHSGNYSAGISWDYDHQDEWIIAEDVFVSGNLQFWSMGFQGSDHGDHYYVKVSTDNQVTWETLFDLSSLPLYPGGYNQWQEPYTVNLSAYMGENIDIAWQAWEGTSQGCWYYWAIDDCSVGGKKLEFTMAQPLYDVFRKDPGAAEFVVVNSQPLTDTSYIDHSLPSGLYDYYTQVANAACSQSIPSDTIAVDVITSLEDFSQRTCSVFPNPASDWITIKSAWPVSHVLMINLLGIPVLEFRVNGLCETSLGLEQIPSGQYVLRVSTSKGTREFLISVIK